MRDDWVNIDRYFEDAMFAADPVLAAAEEAARAAGLPAIAVTPSQGRLLQILALSIGARSILEIGTLGGYSTIWLARGLAPGGRVVTLELERSHADLAARVLARAGLADRVAIRVGPALNLLAELRAERAGPFDLSFIDADKANIPAYFDHAVALSRSGSLIVVDNVVRYGKVLDAKTDDPEVAGVRRFVAAAGTDPRVMVTALQTVGSKGHDGLAIARVL